MIGDTAAAIRRHREAEGMSQSELGRAIGHTSGSVVSKWERTEILPDERSIAKVERALDLRPGTLMTVRQDEWELTHAKAPAVKVMLVRELLREAEDMTDAELLKTLEWVRDNHK